MIAKWQESAATKDEAFAHIEAEEREKIATECAATEKWLGDAWVKQVANPHPNLDSKHFFAEQAYEK
jgi:hypothetical protein